MKATVTCVQHTDFGGETLPDEDTDCLGCWLVCLARRLAEKDPSIQIVTPDAIAESTKVAEVMIYE